MNSLRILSEWEIQGKPEIPICSHAHVPTGSVIVRFDTCTDVNAERIIQLAYARGNNIHP